MTSDQDRTTQSCSVEFTTTEFTQPSMAVSPNGQALFFDLIGEIYEVSIAGGSAKKLDLGPGWKSRPTMSPDGNRLAFLSDRAGPISVWVKDIGNNSGPFEYTQAGDSDVASATWISNSTIVTSNRDLASQVRPRGLTISTDADHSHMSLASSQRSSFLESSLSSSPKGRYLYFKRGTINRLDRTTGVETVEIDDTAASEPKISPSGESLAYVMNVNGNRTLFFKDLRSGRKHKTRCILERQIIQQSNMPLDASYAFLPSGNEVVYGRVGNIYRCLFGGEPRRIPIQAAVRSEISQPATNASSRSGSAVVRYGAYHPKTGQAAFVAQGRIWMSEAGDERSHRLSEDKDLEYMPMYSPSGKSLLYVAVSDQRSSQIRIRDIATGSTKALVTESALIANPAWSADGKYIAYLKRQFGQGDGAAELRWVNLKGEGKSFGSVLPTSNTDRELPFLTWSSTGSGVFYTTEYLLGHTTRRELVYHSLSNKISRLYDLDIEILDARLSPNAELVAFQSARGLYIAPTIASDADPISLGLRDIEKLEPVFRGAAHHFSWADNRHLIWSNGGLYLSDLISRPRLIANPIVVEDKSSRIRRVAYVGPRIITMTSQGTIENGLIITADKKLEYVGRFSAASNLVGAKIIDLSGKTIIPGLIDVHYHLPAQGVEQTFPLQQRLFASLAYGVTTVFDPSISTVESSAISEGSHLDQSLSPTFYGSGYPVNGQYGTANRVFINSYNDALELSTDLARSGAPIIKEYLLGTRTERRWMVQAARSIGVGITAHEQSNLGVKLGLVVDGYTGIEHDIVKQPLYEDVLGFLAKSNVALTPTLGVSGEGGEYMLSERPHHNQRYSCLIGKSVRDRKPISSQEIALKKYTSGYGSVIAANFAEILNDGGNVSVGGHGSAPGLDTHWEIWLLAMAGASPSNALRAATFNGARKLGMTDQIGALAAGMNADFVVLNSNPLEDIRSTTDISQVVRHGRTITWPTASQPPAAWNAEMPWEACRAWNLGQAHEHKFDAPY